MGRTARDHSLALIEGESGVVSNKVLGFKLFEVTDISGLVTGAIDPDLRST